MESGGAGPRIVLINDFQRGHELVVDEILGIDVGILAIVSVSNPYAEPILNGVIQTDVAQVVVVRSGIAYREVVLVFAVVAVVEAAVTVLPYASIAICFSLGYA